MLTSVPTNGGMVIITQMCPQGPSAVPTGAPQAESVLPHNYTSPRDASLKRFVKGEPTALGVVQIMIGLFFIGLGVVTLQERFIVGVPIWTGAMHIVSGALSIAGEKRKKNNICLIKAALSMNIVSAVAAGIAIIINATDLAIQNYYHYRHPVIVIQYGANPQPATQPSNDPGYQLAPDTEQDTFPKTPPPQYTE
ncbi:membrane-spanning 4-domains subfamily A member 15 isoform X2 [Amia ocellicauda]|uniref:membrane-spanning 4-domains subfamily A member 15 isoform X2 n=1 Tax=Amia ocellicauda TaxID=2972642 RepID=UPI003464CF9C